VTWLGFWAFLLVASLGVFAVVVVVVTIGAAGDLRDLLKKRPGPARSDEGSG
jgi:hypothetical protein